METQRNPSLARSLLTRLTSACRVAFQRFMPTRVHVVKSSAERDVEDRTISARTRCVLRAGVSLIIQQHVLYARVRRVRKAGMMRVLPKCGGGSFAMSGPGVPPEKVAEENR